jgi:hypothetical protein
MAEPKPATNKLSATNTKQEMLDAYIAAKAGEGLAAKPLVVQAGQAKQE